MLCFTQWVKEANLNHASIVMNKVQNISKL
jgi:hypothetical protein